jgi:diguanylate cyclase (GGDEF)-like protein
VVFQFPRRLNIRTRMLLLCLGVAAPLLAIGSLAVLNEYRTLKSEASRATAFEAATVVRTVRQWMRAQVTTLGALASLPQMQWLEPGYARRIFATALQAEPDWDDLSLVDTNQNLLVVVCAKGTPETQFDPEPLRRDNFFQQVITSRKGLISGYNRSPITGQPALLAATPVFLNGHIQGMIVASIKPKAILRLFTGLGDGDGSMVAVVDSSKRVIARTLQSEYWEGKDFSQARTVKAASKVAKGQIELVGIADPIPRAYAFERVPENNWHVEVGVPLDTIYGSAHDWLLLMVVLCGCALGISIVLAFSATNHFTRNISILVREALALGKGDLSKRVNIPARDELGKLARAFNQMAEQLELNRDLKLMVDSISESIRHSLDLQEILNTSVRELGTALSASRCCLAILDTHDTADMNDDELVFDYVWWDDNRGGAPLHNRTIRIAKDGVLKMILEQGSILSLDVIGDDWNPLFEESGESPADWKSIKSLIACPINSNDGAIGLVLVHQCDELRTWTDAELELVDGITSHVALAMQHARLYIRTKTMAEQEMLINHIVSSVRSSLDLDTILSTVCLEVGRALGADRCMIAQPRPEGPLIVTHDFHGDKLTSAKSLNLYSDQIDFHPNEPATVGNAKHYTLLGINLEKLLGENGSPLHSLRTDDPSMTQGESPMAVINNIHDDSRSLPFREFLTKVDSQSLIAAPLLNDKRLVGLLMVHQCQRARNWRASEIRLLAAVADQLAIAISHAQLFAQVKYQAITDGLTGLYNHIYFKNRLAEEIKTAQRKGLPCSLLMIDLDKLKQINDNFGHPVGDAAIRQVSSILKKLLRSGDTAARYGGEEFGVILPGTSLAEAALIADRLCAQIRNTPVPGLGKISVSIGGACYPQHATTSAELIAKADKALYVAKNSGRDQARLHEEEPVTISRPAIVLPREAEVPR